MMISSDKIVNAVLCAGGQSCMCSWKVQPQTCR